MNFRTTLLGELQTQLSGTSLRVSEELPWSSAGDELYLKNPKVLYMDAEERERVTLVNTMSNIGDIFERIVTINAYFSVDAKNLVSDIDTILDRIIDARLVPPACHVRNVNIENEYEADRKIYTIEYVFQTI